MNSKKLRKFAALLAVSSVMTACGTAAQGGAETMTSDVSVTSETTADPAKDDLPSDLDYTGREFRIFSRLQAWFNGSWISEEENGDTLNDAIYKRNSRVVDRLGITISEVGSDNSDQAKNSVLAGDDAYDIINTRCSIAFNYAESGLFYDVGKLDYIDFSKSYWDAQLNENVTICGKSFFPIGASNITSYDYTHVLVFNKKLAEDKKVGDLYSLVRNGTWTIDSFSSTVKDFSEDLNGDSVMDDSDLYGYISQPKAVLPAFWIASGVLSVNMNEKDEPEFTMPSDTKFLDVFEKTFAVTYDNNSWYKNTSDTNNDDTLINMFQNGKGLFMDMTFFYISSLRNMDADFGILPYPKYDEAQKDYLARIEGIELTGVPVTADTEFVSAIMEAMASESATTVVPAYYDVALKTKMARDNDSADMLDIIFENRVFDLGDTIWCDEIRDGVFKPMFTTGNRSLSSKFATMQSKMDAKIADTISSFRSIGD